MKKEKKYIQACDIGGSIYGKKSSTGKKVSPNHRSVGKNDIRRVYNKFYKDQVTALYNAINKDK